MEKVPQIVSERLKAATSALDHPDADLLTAFSESSLSRSERAAIVAHLARCGQCREVVALALPASEPVQEAIRPGSSGWLAWPVLRWGFITAGIFAIASFGVMRYQHRVAIVGYLKTPSEATATEARSLQPVSPSSQPSEGQDKAPTAPTSVPNERKSLSPTENSATPSAEMPVPTTGGPIRSRITTSGEALPHGPRVQWQQNNKFQQQAAVQSAPTKQLPFPPMQRSAAPAADTGSVEVESAPAALSANMDSSTVQNKIDQRALQNGRADTRIERSKPAATTVANVPAANVPSLASPAKAQLTQNAQAVAVSGTSVLWTITNAGGLQRSLDQGKTWQDIDVNSSSAMGDAGLALMKAPARAKEIAADTLSKKDSSAPLVFRAVASNGPDVWVGASGGYLYHTTDAGAHWNRVAPSTAGASLTGDIISLEFIDLQHGRVVTSTPEIWTTSDGGQSWQKQ